MSRSDDPTPPTLEQRARRRVAMKSGFYIHALVYLLVNGGLLLLGLLGSGYDIADRGWIFRHGGLSRLPLWGWGLGLAIHGIVVFVRLQGEGLHRRMVEREVEALRRRDGDDGPHRPAG